MFFDQMNAGNKNRFLLNHTICSKRKFKHYRILIDGLNLMHNSNVQSILFQSYRRRNCEMSKKPKEKWKKGQIALREKERASVKNRNRIEMIAYLFISFIIVDGGVTVAVTVVTSYFSSCLVFIDF